MTSRKEEKERLRQERLEAQARAAREERKKLILGYITAALLSGAVIAGIVFAITSGSGSSDDSPTITNAEGEEVDPEDVPSVRTEFGVVPEGAVVDDREGVPPPELVVGDLAASADAAGCRLDSDLEESGNSHYADELKEADNWETTPPTSGDHYGVPTETGSGALADGPYLTTPPLARVVHAHEHSRVSIQYDPEMPEQEQLALKGIYDADPSGAVLFPNPELEGELAVASWTGLMSCEKFDPETGSDAVRNFVLQFRGRGPEDVPF